MEEIIKKIFASETRLVLAATGGGGGAIQRLLTVPGCSACVLEIVVPYANTALHDWLGVVPAQYVSEATARYMSMRAWQRARELATDAKGETSGNVDTLLGIGVTATLATSRPKRGEHRVHVAVQTANYTKSYELVLEKNARSRLEEDQIASSLVLRCLTSSAGVPLYPLELRSAESVLENEAIALESERNLLLGEKDWITVGESAFSSETMCLFPGAFNPLHTGHRQMMEVAEQLTGRKIAAEICIQNVDKPLLDYWDMQSRAAQFQGLCPVVFTRAATFLEKAKLFPETIFIVGADTISRIAHARYYNNDPFARDAALQSLADWNVKFLVFGRTQGDGHFQELDDLQLPAILENLCTRVSEKQFRADISSTELRGE
jgi:nicotinamide mononucleotide (NMN) deamidase PncC/nicotinic acid mononucleotide adenylyltransferase